MVTGCLIGASVLEAVTLRTQTTAFLTGFPVTASRTTPLKPRWLWKFWDWGRIKKEKFKYRIGQNIIFYFEKSKNDWPATRIPTKLDGCQTSKLATNQLEGISHKTIQEWFRMSWLPSSWSLAFHRRLKHWWIKFEQKFFWKDKRIVFKLTHLNTIWHRLWYLLDEQSCRLQFRRMLDGRSWPCERGCWHKLEPNV